MKKSIKSFLILLLLVTMIVPITYSYAVGEFSGNFKEEIKEKSFFETSKLEYSKNEKVEMTINLNEIKYNKFMFELKSSENMKNVEIDPNASSKTLDVEKSENELIIEIDKATTNLSTIALYYQIPEQMQVNDTIKFTATITNMEIQEKEEESQEDVNEKEEIKQEEIKVEDKKEETKPETEIQAKEINQNENKPEEIKPETDNKENTSEEKEEVKIEPETETKIVEIKIVEQKEQPNTDNKEENKDNNKNEGTPQINIPNNTEKPSNQVNMNNTSSQKFNVGSYSSSMPVSTTPKVTYNGSDNNYLSELNVEGHELNKKFSKDNSTYFLTVENSVNSLNIDTNTEESTSTVCVYGNEEIVTGTNKILISVTAENGNVRNYRIYVTKNS